MRMFTRGPPAAVSWTSGSRVRRPTRVTRLIMSPPPLGLVAGGGRAAHVHGCSARAEEAREECDRVYRDSSPANFEMEMSASAQPGAALVADEATGSDRLPGYDGCREKVGVHRRGLGVVVDDDVDPVAAAVSSRLLHLHSAGEDREDGAADRTDQVDAVVKVGAPAAWRLDGEAGGA